MKKVNANIPSKKEFFVNENGEIFNQFGKPLLGKLNPNSKTLRALDFLNTENKRQSLSFQKVVWNTFNSEDPILQHEIILLKNPESKFPFALNNLTKVSRKENIKIVNEIRLNNINNKKNLT